MEGKHLQAALQRAAGVLSGLCLLQCGLQVNLLILKGKFGFFEVRLYVVLIVSELPTVEEVSTPKVWRGSRNISVES